MSNQMKWVNRQARLGWIFFAAGVVLAVTGFVLQLWAENIPFNARIITGLGILLLGISISYLVKYRSAQRDPQAAARMASEELDERTQSIRAQAGNRAYWISVILAYAGLMWVSFAQNGSLPMLSDDALWYFLAGLVIIPFVVYAASIYYDEEHG